MSLQLCGCWDYDAAAMSSPKKHQHFVPRFYLSAFASAPRRVNLFNIPRSLFVRDASIRDQCRVPWFYGRDDGLENAIEDVENLVAPVLAALRAGDPIPEPQSSERFFLNFFTALQLVRTTRALRTAKELTSKLDAALEELNIESTDDGVPIEIGEYLPSPDQLVLDRTLNCADGIATLDLHCFSVSQGAPELLTSDHPAVFYNQYCEEVPGRGVVGVLSRGVQIFLPIDPRTLLLFYDPGVYQVGRRRHTISKVENPAHVHELNRLQAAWADTTLYFADWSSRSAVKRVVARAWKDREAHGGEVAILEDPTKDDAGILQIRSTTPLWRLKLPHCKVKRRARRVPLSDRANQTRHGDEIPKEVLHALAEWKKARTF